MQFAPGKPSEVLVTSADSRIRILDGSKIVHKFRGIASYYLKLHLHLLKLNVLNSPTYATNPSQILNVRYISKIPNTFNLSFNILGGFVGIFVGYNIEI